jgi:hypothetical protein
VAVGHRAAEVAAVPIPEAAAGHRAEVAAVPIPEVAAVTPQGEVAGPRVAGVVDPMVAVGPASAALRGVVVVGVVEEEALRGRRWCPV